MPRGLVFLLFGLLAAAGVGLQCSTYSGAPTDAGAGTADAAAGTVTCSGSEKLCAGTCVSLSDPRFGCGAKTCEPCALPNTKASRCEANGQCGVAQCAPGWDYCEATAGCTVDPQAPETCGGCSARGGANCSLSEVCYERRCVTAANATNCGPTGSGKPLTNCDRACVDLLTHPRHCGACTTACATTGGGAAICANAKCAVDCDENHAHCTGDPATCEALLPVYADRDGDTWGSTPVLVDGKGKFACKGAAGEATRGGDCLDDPANPAAKNVFPQQMQRFSVPYTVGNSPSFDYNCNGIVEPNAPNGGSCSPCVPGFLGTATCGSVGALSTCAGSSSSSGGSSSSTSGGGACPYSAMVTCR
jgi:hypothetical protein